MNFSRTHTHTSSLGRKRKHYVKVVVMQKKSHSKIQFPPHTYSQQQQKTIQSGQVVNPKLKTKEVNPKGKKTFHQLIN